jgi:penicillin amidase
VRDPIVIKGRAAPFVFETVMTPHGFVIASDREQHKVFTLRWSGTEAGAAAELGSLALDRARDWTTFREALAHWKMPVAQLVYADVDGNVGFQDAGLVPIRGRNDWTGWRSPDALAHAFNPSGRSVG